MGIDKVETEYDAYRRQYNIRVTFSVPDFTHLGPKSKENLCMALLADHNSLPVHKAMAAKWLLTREDREIMAGQEPPMPPIPFRKVNLDP